MKREILQKANDLDYKIENLQEHLLRLNEAQKYFKGPDKRGSDLKLWIPKMSEILLRNEFVSHLMILEGYIIRVELEIQTLNKQLEDL